MTKIHCKYGFINNILAFEMEKILYSLEDATKISDNIVIPNDFEYYRSLKNTFNDIKTIRNNIKKKNDYLKDIGKSSKKVVENIEEYINDSIYESFDLEVRKNII